MILKYQHLLLSILILVGCSPKSDEHSELLVLKGATIIDGTGNPAIENGLLIIKGGRIQKVGRAEAIKIPKGVKIIDFSGKWIVPGYVDAHIHFWESGRTWTSPTYVLDLQKFVSYEEETEFIKNRISYTLEKYLCAGVTSVAPLGAVNWEYKVRTLAEKQQKTPRIYLAGGFIANTPPELDNQYFEGEPTGFWIEKEEDAKKLIAYLDSTNVDLIKAGFIEGDNDYPIEEFLPKLKLLIEESHLRGLPVSVHAMELSNAKHVIRSGADVLAHTVTDKIIDEEFIQLAKQNDVIITSSLGIYKAFKEVFTNSYTLSDMDYCCGDSEVIDSWKEWASIPKEEKPQIPDWIMSAEESFKIMIENTRLANEAGLTISVGTDA